RVGADETVTADAFPKDLDLVVSVGGDGTFLRAAQLAAVAACPVLGVKVGRVGFLTEVEPGEAAPLIDAALEGRATIEERLAVDGEEPGILSTDGRESLELPVGSRVTVAAAEGPLRLVRRPDAESFYGRVREKFGLPGEEGM